MRRNSDANLSHMGNGDAHMGPGSLEDKEPRIGSSRQDFPPMHSIGRESLNGGAGPMPNGGLHGALNGLLDEGSSEQPSSMNQNHIKTVSSVEWNSHALGSRREPKHGQV